MKSKIANLINRMGNDKKNHLILFTLGYLILLPLIHISYAYLITCILAGLVEAYDDMSKKGTPEIWDFVASIALPTIHVILVMI